MNWRTGLRPGRAVGAAVVATVVTMIIVGTAVSIRVASLAPEGGPPPSEEAIEAMVERIASVVGPTVGFVTTLLAGWWAARGLGALAVRQGLVVGAIIGVVGLALEAIAGGITHLMVISRAAEVGAGALGGWVAARRTR